MAQRSRFLTSCRVDVVTIVTERVFYVSRCGGGSLAGDIDSSLGSDSRVEITINIFYLNNDQYPARTEQTARRILYILFIVTQTA